eukprot:777643-Rhodomonas_salina.1
MAKTDTDLCGGGCRRENPAPPRPLIRHRRKRVERWFLQEQTREVRRLRHEGEKKDGGRNVGVWGVWGGLPVRSASHRLVPPSPQHRSTHSHRCSPSLPPTTCSRQVVSSNYLQSSGG